MFRGRHGVAAHRGRPEPAGVEEPQTVALDRTAEDVFVLRDDAIHLGVGRELVVVVSGHLRAPVVVVQRVAERSAEAIAARLGDDVHDAAAEPPVLRRDAVGRDHRLLDGILYIEVVRLPAQVLVHVHAVDQVEGFERHRSGDGIAAIRARGVHCRSLQDHGIDVACGGQHGHQLLLEVGGHLRRMCQDLTGARADGDRFGQRRGPQCCVERDGLAEGHGDRLLLTFESGQLERHGVGSRRHARDDVVAVAGRDHAERALQVGTSDRHRDARQRESLAVDNPSRDRAGRRLRRGTRGQQQGERESENRFEPPH